MDDELAALGPLTDDKLSEWIPELLQFSADPRLADLTVEHWLVGAVVIRLANGQRMVIVVRELHDKKGASSDGGS